jgi:hypothetical protein
MATHAVTLDHGRQERRAPGDDGVNVTRPVAEIVPDLAEPRRQLAVELGAVLALGVAAPGMRVACQHCASTIRRGERGAVVERRTGRSV